MLSRKIIYTLALTFLSAGPLAADTKTEKNNSVVLQNSNEVPTSHKGEDTPNNASDQNKGTDQDKELDKKLIEDDVLESPTTSGD